MGLGYRVRGGFIVRQGEHGQLDPPQEVVFALWDLPVQR